MINIYFRVVIVISYSKDAGEFQNFCPQVSGSADINSFTM